MVLHDPEGSDDVRGPHRRNRADRLAASATGELNDHLPARFPHVHVRRCMLARRQEDDDPKPGDSKDRGHALKIT